MSSNVMNLRNSTVLLIALSFALALPGSAQSVKNSNRSGLAAFDATREITLQGTIKEVVSHPPAGSLMGLHLTVASTTGTQDVHLGSHLPKSVTQNLLRDNAPVIVVGSYVDLAGNNILLARQLVVAGQVIAVRNQHGFVIRPKPDGVDRRVARTVVAGGAQ
jgi:hypothetical protein